MWGNPQNWREWDSLPKWRGRDRENRQHAKEWFEQELTAGRLAITCDDVRAALRCKDLACWCVLCPEHKDGLPLGVTCDACSPCHADVLLELANGDGEP